MPASIYVLAGVNGAGKSSIGGAAIQVSGGTYYNPDLQTKALLDRDPSLDQERANGLASEQGRKGLADALLHQSTFAYETTLGARTITDMLIEGAVNGAQIHVWYAGLKSPELHLARIRSRVAAGGHHIPEDRVRARYDSSRANLIRLLPFLSSLRVYDNSEDGDPKAGTAPRPKLVLAMSHGRIDRLQDVDAVPMWAKPIVAAAVRSKAP